jgi:indole-3-glycerol phosphate synthase
LLLSMIPLASAFAPQTFLPATPSTSFSSSRLFAIGVLAKKAKQADLKKYIQEEGVDDSVMQVYQELKGKLDSVDLSNVHNSPPGPLQQALTKRKGTITVIAEFKRRNDQCETGFIREDIFAPELLSPMFREYGVSAIAVLACPRMGGCDYNDLQQFVQEQSRAKYEVPGPVMIINSDLIVDELQVARTKACGASACVITYSVVITSTTTQSAEGEPESEQTLKEDTSLLTTLLKACKAVDIEAIVAVSTHQQAQKAIDLGARILCVSNVDGVEDKVKVIEGLKLPESPLRQDEKSSSRSSDGGICTIASIIAKNNKQLQEIEEAWALRDKGFNCAWVGDALYKGGADSIEHPGAIIRSMKSKSSLKWASPKAYSGKGEGAREYLGDILM